MVDKNVEMKNDDVVEIPVGKIFGLNSIRKNPWILSSIVLLVILIVVVFMRSSGPTANVVNENSAAQNLIDFVNSQGNGEASLVSVDKQDSLYKVMFKYKDQDASAYVTLDGKFAVSESYLVPLTDVPQTNTGNTATTNTNTGNTKVSIDPEKIKDAPVEGNKNAKVTIVEFSDFQCPFCEKYYTESYKQLKKEYIDTGKVKYILMNFPLSFHPEAQKAAESSLCVREQKGDTGYWKMHDKLFENQGALGVENEKKWARELRVDGAKFDSCLDSGKFASKVQADEAYGQSLGVSGTPGFFINGIEIVGAQPYSAFKQIIDSELASAGNSTA